MASIVIPFIVAIYRFEELNSATRLIALLVLVSLVGELCVFGLAYIIQNNLPAVHFFTIAQFVLLVLIFEKGLVPMLPVRFFRATILGFMAFAIVDGIWLSGIYNFNVFSRPLACLLLLFLAIAFFYKTLRELKIVNLTKEPLYWICIGVIIYFSGSLFIFLFTNYVKSSNEVLITLWSIHAIFNIILNASYTKALWTKPAN